MDSKSKIKNLLSFWKSQSPSQDDSEEHRRSMRRSRSQPNVNSDVHGIKRGRSLSSSKDSDTSKKSTPIASKNTDSDEWTQPVIRAKRVLSPTPNRNSVHFGDTPVQPITTLPNSAHKYEEPIYAEPRKILRENTLDTILTPPVPPEKCHDTNWSLEMRATSRYEHLYSPVLSPIDTDTSMYHRTYMPKSSNLARDQRMNIMTLEQSPSKRKGPVMTSTPGKGDHPPMPSKNESSVDPESTYQSNDSQNVGEGWIRLSSNVIGPQKGNLLDSIDLTDQQDALCETTMESLMKTRSQPCLDNIDNNVLFDKIDFLSQQVIESLDEDKVVLRHKPPTKRVPAYRHSYYPGYENHDIYQHHSIPYSIPIERSFSPHSESSHDSNHSPQRVQMQDPNASYYRHHQHDEKKRHRSRKKSSGQKSSRRTHSQDHVSKKHGKASTKEFLRDRYLINQQMSLLQPTNNHHHQHHNHHERINVSKNAYAGSGSDEENKQPVCTCQESKFKAYVIKSYLTQQKYYP